MASVVEHLFRRLVCVGLVERKKEHATLCAKPLLLSRRVPTSAESFRRENYPLSATFGDGVPAILFERAHEGRDSRAAWSNSRSSGNGIFPLRRALRGRSMAFNRHEHWKRKERIVSVCEPFATKEADAANRPEELCVAAAKGSPLGVFTNVAAKGGKLAIALDDPIMPRGGEYWRRRGRAGRNTREEAGRNTRGKSLLSGFAGRRVCGDNLPIDCAKGFGELADYHAKGHAIRRGLYLHQQVNVIGHDHEGRYRLNAAPFEVEAFNHAFEGSRDVASDKAAIVADLREIGEAVKSLERHHVEERRLVVEVEEASHVADSMTICGVAKWCDQVRTIAYFRIAAFLCLFASPRSNDFIDSRSTRWLASDQKGSGFSETTSNGRRRRMTDCRRKSRTALVRSSPVLAKRASASLRRFESTRICSVDVAMSGSFVLKTHDIIAQLHSDCNGGAVI